MIAEGVVLFRIEDLEQRRGRVAAEVRAELVDLVEDEHRVAGFGAPQALDDLAGQGADVGAAVTADLGLVAHAAERHPDELAAQRLGDRAGQRRLADPGRADEAEDRPLHAGVQLAHRQVFEDALLGPVEPGVLGVEDAARLGQVDDLVGPLGPRQRDDPVEIGARHRVLGGGGRHLRQPVELAQRFLLHRLGQPGGIDLLAQLLDVLGLVVAFAELPLNRLQLLAQEVVALVLADLRLHLRLDLRAELEHLELLDQEPVEVVEAGADVERLEHFLLGRGRHRAQARGDEVGGPAGLGDVRGQRLQVVRHQRRQRDDLLEVDLDVALQRVDLQPIAVGQLLRRLGDVGQQIRPAGDDAVEPHPGQALDDDAQAAVRQLEHLVDVAGGADGVEVVLARVLFRGLTLGEDGNHPAGRDGVVDQPHRALASHRQRHERIGEQHRVAQRQHGEFSGNLERLLGRRIAGLESIFLIAHRDPPGDT